MGLSLSLSKTYKLLIYTTVFFIYYILFLNQGFSADWSLCKFSTDIGFHIAQSQLYWHGNWLKLFRQDFEPVLHIAIAGVAFILDLISGNSQKMNFANANALCLSLAKLVQFIFIKKIIDSSVDLNEISSLFLTIIVNFCTVLYLPFITLNSYLLMGTPNPLHSPTTIFLTPLAIIFFYYYIKKFIINLDPSYQDSLLLSLLLFIATLTKPAFTNVMLVLIGCYYLFNPKRFISRIFYKDLIIYIPSFIILLLLMVLISHNNDAGGKLIFAPFKVINAYTHHAVISLLQAIIFPLVITLVYSIHQTKWQYVKFSWVYVIISYIIFALFSFKGPSWTAANLSWSYQLGLTFLYIFTIIDYAKLASAPITFSHQEWIVKVCSVGLSLLFLSGIYRLIKFFMGSYE